MQDPNIKFSHDPRNNSFAQSDIVNNGRFNKGTAFSEEERYRYKLRGLLPPHIESISEQAARCLDQFHRKTSSLQKYIYLQQLRGINETLYYHLLLQNVEEMLPIVYTPTVGLACQKFADVWRRSRGMYLSLQDKGEIREILNNWTTEPDIIVVTDGSRILGLGDLGINGMGIPIGKLSLYVAGAGFHPARTLPITIDVGTNNEEFLKDPFYLGLRRKRVRGIEFFSFMEEFMTAVKHKWPKVLVQFEDFSNDVCFSLLEKYRHRQLCFNDDIQGTGCVILAGFINAVKLSGIPLKDHRLLFIGAGSAAVGVADQIAKIFKSDTDLTESEIKERFYLLDSRGLVTDTRGDLERIKLVASHKLSYIRTDIPADSDLQTKNIHHLVEHLKPTVICGLSGASPGVFTKDIIETHSNNHKRPIIFALSNPTSKSECSAEDAIKYSDGRAIFASGSPFAPVVYKGKEYKTMQGNNLYVFPGIGLGSVIAEAKKVTENMILAAAKALADSVSNEELAQGMIYPGLSNIRDISISVATAVVRQAIEDGVAQIDLKVLNNLDSHITGYMYEPDYAKPRYSH